MPATLDALAFDTSLEIQAEIILDIHHALITAPGADLAAVTSVASHPQATGQSRRWLARNLPGRTILAANSTAEAVQHAVADPNVAAVGTRLAAELYGGEIREPAIEDYADNQTRFVLIGRGLRERTGRDKTSLALFMKADRPGTLHMVLGEFVYGEINLTKIQSRPTKRQLGDYMFFIDLEGHVDDANVKTALDCLRLKMREVRISGKLPARLALAAPRTTCYGVLPYTRPASYTPSISARILTTVSSVPTGTEMT